MIKNKVVAFILFLIVFLLLWTGIDLLVTLVITRAQYHFEAWDDLILPLIIGAVLGYLFIIRGNGSEKK